MPFRATLGVALCCALAAVAAACRGDDPPPPTPAPPPTFVAPSPTATATATAGPPTEEPTSPILQGVDLLVEAVEAGDAEAIMVRFHLAPIPCSNDTWPQPACPPGQPAGTLVRAFPFVGCEAQYLALEDLRIVVNQVLVGRDPVAFAALETDQQPGAGMFPLGPFAVVFQTSPPLGLPHPTGVLAILSAEGYVVSLRTGCLATPEHLVDVLPNPQPMEGWAPAADDDRDS